MFWRIVYNGRYRLIDIVRTLSSRGVRDKVNCPLIILEEAVL
jgi:hypothetical protein